MKTEPTEALRAMANDLKYNTGVVQSNIKLVIEESFISGVKYGQSSPKIKQLEWNFYGLYYLAQTPFGRYTFEENEKNENVCDLRFGNLLLRNNIPVNEAKAAAQADFEKRIKECLE